MVPFILLGLIISGVYYDPIQAENGGEAIVLENNGSTPITLPMLVTKSSSITLPSSTLLPGQGYLIADTGWSTLRDNASWPDADFETSLSLANTESFVELRQDNITLDRLAWNSTNKSREGYMFTHSGESAPVFRNSSSSLAYVDATVTILNGPPQILGVSITDDAQAAGVQLLSYNRTITVSARIFDVDNDTINAAVTFLGKQYELEQNASTFTAEIPLESVTPGNYSLTITADDGSVSVNETEEITVLSSTSISVDGELVFRGAASSNQTASFSLRNNGNTAKTVSVNRPIAGMSCNLPIKLGPGESSGVRCSMILPSAAPGTYNYKLQLLVT